MPPSAFRLISIRVTGSSRYQPEAVIAASGLSLGQTVSEDDFKQTSKKLGQTGAFSDVAYAFQFSPQGAKLDLQVADSAKFVAARFDNFVWLSDSELLSQLHGRVPLFQGELPVAGELPDQVSDALQSLVLEQNIRGHADYLRSPIPGSDDIDAYVYTISGPAIKVRHIDFPGASPAELPALQAAAGKLEDQNFSRAALRTQAEKYLVPAYLERGYLKAAFAEAIPKVVKESADEVLVDISFAVNPGVQYKASGIKFAAREVFPITRLQELIHQQNAQPLNEVRLREDLENVKKLYQTRGYMEAAVRLVPDFDDEHSTVAYVVEISQGEAYKMGDLDIRGLDSRSSARLVEAWKLRGGDPYDSSSLAKFLDETSQLLPAGEWNVDPHVTVDDSGKTVDVTIR